MSDKSPTRIVWQSVIDLVLRWPPIDAPAGAAETLARDAAPTAKNTDGRNHQHQESKRNGKK